MLIEVSDISIRFGAHHIVKNINWKIGKNEHWVLFGLNGCGKTTLLRALAGYLGTNSGRIIIDDSVELDKETKTGWRIQSGFVSLAFFNQCYKNESVLDVVLSGLYGSLGVRNSVTSSDVRKVKRILREMGLGKKHQYPFYTLSSGQRQKVLLARALVHEPDVLFLDEPFNGLDILGQIQFKEMLDDWMKEDGHSLVSVVHHCDEITPLYTHAALMKNGKLFKADRIKEVFNTEVISGFLDKDVSVNWRKDYFSIEILNYN